MSTKPPPTPSGQRRIGAATAGGQGERGGRGKSAQTRINPGTGQAVALTERAAAIADDRGVTRKKYPRAELLREIIEWGLSRTPADVRGQGEVPAGGADRPKAEKSITYIPTVGELAKLDKQADGIGISRNELLRRHIAAWLAENPTA